MNTYEIKLDEKFGAGDLIEKIGQQHADVARFAGDLATEINKRLDIIAGRLSAMGIVVERLSIVNAKPPSIYGRGVAVDGALAGWVSLTWQKTNVVDISTRYAKEYLALAHMSDEADERRIDELRKLVTL